MSDTDKIQSELISFVEGINDLQNGRSWEDNLSQLLGL